MYTWAIEKLQFLPKLIGEQVFISIILAASFVYISTGLLIGKRRRIIFTNHYLLIRFIIICIATCILIYFIILQKING